MLKPSTKLAFLAACGRASISDEGLSQEHEDLVRRLEAALDRAHAVHPNLGVEDDAFAGVFGTCAAGAEDLAGTFAALDALNVEDLYLATGCVRGVPSAIAALEREHLGPARAALARMLGPSEASDGTQILR